MSNLSGSQCRNPRFLYLTNLPENALWYAEQKGDNSVVQIEVDSAMLRVDPEDGVYETIEEELSLRQGLPGVVILCREIHAGAFKVYLAELTSEAEQPTDETCESSPSCGM